MIRSFARDALVYGAATVLARATSLLVVPIYTRFLSTADYGVIDLLTIAGTLILLTVAVEVSQAVARFLPEGDDEDRIAIASTALAFSVGAYAIFGIVGLIAATDIRTWLIGDAADDLTVRLAVVGTCLNGIFQLTAGVLRFQLRASRFAIASLSSSVITIGVGVVLLVSQRMGVDAIFVGQIVGGAIGAVLCLAFSRRLYRPIFDLDRLGSMLRFSAPLVPSSIGVFVLLFVDRFAIGQLMTVGDVGVFGIGYRLASAVSLLSVGAQMAVTPLVYARHADPATPLALEQIFRHFVAAALLVGLVLSLFAEEILRLITTPAYYGGAIVVPLLVPALFLANLYVFMPGLEIAKRTAAFAVINLSGALLNLLLNFLFIPSMGILGAALATLISATAVFTAYAIGSHRAYPVPHRWSRLLAAVASVTVVYVAITQLDLDLVEGVLIKAAGIGVAALAIQRIGLLRGMIPAR
jgi:O-antigen/teichoic acid export membrane protein